MRIVDFSIQNYRSLRDVSMNDLGNLNILLGKNSSGKSNVLEALSLFFSEFAVTGGNTPGLNEYFWSHNARDDPITFTVRLQFDPDELDDIFTQAFIVSLGLDRGPPEIDNTVEIKRQLLNVQGTWKTVSISLGGHLLVQDDALPETITYGETSTDKSPATVTTISKTLQIKIQTSLTAGLRSKFKVLTINRDGRGSDRFRATLADPQVQATIWSLDQSLAFSESERYGSFEEAFGKTTGLRLDPAQSRIMVRKEFRRTPLELEGGGVQTSANLLGSMLLSPDRNQIIAIEEPESHLHPEMQRNLSREIEKRSKHQQIFLATHSPIIVSAIDSKDVWLVKESLGQTQVLKTADFAKMLSEVGARPSDVLFNNKIVFVEGRSDKIILEAFIRKLQLNSSGIELLPIRGKNNASRALEGWISVTQKVIPLFLILDKDAQKDVDALLGSHLIEERDVHIWEGGSIEHYYPESLLSPVLNELNNVYKLDLNVPKIVNEIQNGKLQPSEIDLGSKKEFIESSWKVAFATEMAAQIERTEIEVPREVKETLIRATSVGY